MRHREGSSTLRRVSAAYVGGLVGALDDSFDTGFSARRVLGIGLRPEWTAPWLYPRLVWGGVWGLLFLLPVLRARAVLRGVVFSLAPTAVVLFAVFPGMGKGPLGLGFGALTPALVALLNFGWGIVASVWYRQAAR
ncbi:MAG: hypothetical protein HY900_04285 [Deltaproteobacteria bacterium]|nr:hypothetical protein [Deltaproteobacteria bacterium]